MTLDEQIRIAFTTFDASLCEQHPGFARERELVSRFVFQHLLPVIAPGRPLFDPGQLGIEVAVPQRRTPGHRRKFPDVCKDIVVWPRPGMVCWLDDGVPDVYPVAILEWKSLNRKDPAGVTRRKRGPERDADREWLMWFTTQAPNALGFSVLVDSRSAQARIEVDRSAAGQIEREWLSSLVPDCGA